MIALELAGTADDRHRIELLQTLENLSKDQARMGDCLECQVYERIPQSNDFMWHQWWRSERQLEGHLGSVAFRTLLGAIKVLGTLESARVVELQDSTSVMGAFLEDRVSTSESPSGV
jgi:quinol monooxygenase YgiN